MLKSKLIQIISNSIKKLSTLNINKRMSLESAKKIAAEKAVDDHVKENMIIGVGKLFKKTIVVFAFIFKFN